MMERFKKIKNYYIIILIGYCLNLFIGTFYNGSFEFRPLSMWTVDEVIHLYNETIWFSPFFSNPNSNFALYSVIISLLLILLFVFQKKISNTMYLSIESTLFIFFIFTLIGSYLTKYYIYLPDEYRNLVPASRNYYEYFIDLDYNVVWTIHLPGDNNGLFYRYGLAVYLLVPMFITVFIGNSFLLVNEFREQNSNKSHLIEEDKLEIENNSLKRILDSIKDSKTSMYIQSWKRSWSMIGDTTSKDSVSIFWEAYLVHFILSFTIVYMLIAWVPIFFSMIRRLNDRKTSPFVILFILIPIIGALILVIFLVTHSDDNPNFNNVIANSDESNTITKLKELNELKEQGIITEKEYFDLKGRYIDNLFDE
jgi:uncharacterized membrane protein YhaH (DUF805 family)